MLKQALSSFLSIEVPPKFKDNIRVFMIGKRGINFFEKEEFEILVFPWEKGRKRRSLCSSFAGTYRDSTFYPNIPSFFFLAILTFRP